MRIRLYLVKLFIVSFFFLIISPGCNIDKKTNDLPNIVFILADDMGYGDVSALNASSAWKTVNIDKLAEAGMIFSDAHSGSAVCTPTRYGILTGRYSWRSRLKEGVLWSWDKPLIEKNRMTVGSLLQNNGYTTACIGKWHLGLNWQHSDNKPDSIDFSKPVLNGPVTLGFDYFYGITASLDIPPYVYIENDRSTTVPVKYTESKTEYGWWRKGLTGDDFDHEEVLPHLTQKAITCINRHIKERGEKPFFLYFALPSPHTPILPTEEFQGKSGTNPYGDFVLQVDHTVGKVMDALEDNRIVNNTLFIFTSDNGCSPEANYDKLGKYGHDPSYVFRGHKADIFEGGHRMPFIVRWPEKVKAGTESDETICLTDLIATCAAIVGDTLPDSAGEDSYNILPVLSGKDVETVREATVHHSVNGSFAIRKGKWKLIMCPGSGGWSYPVPEKAKEMNLPPVQLYDIKEDKAEKNNLYDRYPEVVEELTSLLQEYIRRGRSTPGEPQEYVKIKDWPDF